MRGTLVLLALVAAATSAGAQGPDAPGSPWSAGGIGGPLGPAAEEVGTAWTRALDAGPAAWSEDRAATAAEGADGPRAASLPTVADVLQAAQSAPGRDRADHALDLVDDALRRLATADPGDLPLPALPVLPGTPPAKPTSPAARAAPAAGAEAGPAGGAADLADPRGAAQQPWPAEAPALAEALPGAAPSQPFGPGAFVPAGAGPWARQANAAPGLLAVVLAGLALLAPVFYHRVGHERVLEHPARRALYEAIKAHPGSTIQAAARRAALNRGTAVHHLRILARHKLVARRPGAKAVHLFPAGGVPDERTAMQLALLARPRARALATLVLAQPGLSQSAAARALGISPSTLGWHLRALAGCGLVEEVALKGRRGLMPRPDLVGALDFPSP